MKLLLNYYHPVILDLALTFQKLGCDVEVSYNTSIKDHYGDWKELINKNYEKYPEFKHVNLQYALIKAKSKQYDLVGCDGVFSGDELLLGVCKEKDLPWFCINGYPYQTDEPSKNILAFSWFLPQVRYLQVYQGEYGVKENDWKNISASGKSHEKNICVFYPNFWKLKENYFSTPSETRNGFGSYIQRYKECNRWTYEVFEKIQKSVEGVQNYEGLAQVAIHRIMNHSKGTLMLKHADCPGISLLESLVLGVPIFTLKSYVLASMNQEVLIDGMTACIADNISELIERMNSNECLIIEPGKYIRELTSFSRQQKKLESFINECIKNG